MYAEKRNSCFMMVLFFFSVPELNPTIYGLSPQDAIPGKDLSLNDLAEQLRLIYCGPMAIEFMHINVNLYSFGLHFTVFKNLFPKFSSLL